jgi:hypothetical protein
LSKYEDAAKALYYLLKDGPVPVDEVIAEMRRCGFSSAHARGARQALSVESQPVYRKTNRVIEMKCIDYWEWSLTEDSTEPGDTPGSIILVLKKPPVNDRRLIERASRLMGR